MASVYQSLRLFQAILVSGYIKYWLIQYELFWCFPIIVGAGTEDTIQVLAEYYRFAYVLCTRAALRDMVLIGIPQVDLKFGHLHPTVFIV